VEVQTQLSTESSATRRRFFVAWIYGVWTAIGTALGLPALVYLLFPPKAKERDEWVEVGDIGELPLKAPEEIVFRRNRKDGWKMTSEKTTAWVAKLSDREVVAFAPMCTHLGCAYHWEEQKQHFLCPCHTSAFGLDGRVIEGPAPRPLDRYMVKIEGTKLKLGPVVQSQGDS
jgi:menaquinol-cytochrome c reductase iron-sulfur subunit